MFNTYLNDYLTSPYPFFGEQQLPFPLSCIAGLGICLQTDTPIGLLYAFSITIGQSSVYMVIGTVQTQNNVETETILGTLFADAETATKTGLLLNQQQIHAAGFLTIGEIPETAIGQYNGRYRIEPSCVTYMPDNVFGFHRKANINGAVYDLGQLVTIEADNLLEISGGTIKGTTAAADSDLVEYTTTYEYPNNIKSVNSIQTTAADYTGTLSVVCQGTAISAQVQNGIVLSGGAAIPPDTQRTANAGVTTVLYINGNKAFPNCYKATDDQANTLGPAT